MKPPRVTLLAIILISLVGASVILISTRWGPWAFSDSTTYIVSARSMLEGEGLGVTAHPGSVERLTHHPPLYPLLLSAIGMSGIQLLDAARWLNVILFAATIFTTGTFTYILLNSSWLAISLSGLMLAVTALVDIFSGAMSEPLFLFTSITSTFVILVFLQTKQLSTLILAALTASLAFLTRYIGVFTIVTGLVALLLLSRASWKGRIKNLVLYGLISILPNVAWWLYVYLSTSTFAARQVLTQADLGQALIKLRLLLVEVFWSWLPFTQNLTYTYNSALKVLFPLGVLDLLLIGLIVYKWWPYRHSLPGFRCAVHFMLTWSIFSLTYLTCLAYAYIFTTPTPDVDLRMLLPMQIGNMIALLSVSLLLLRVLNIPAWGKLGVLAMVLVYMSANLPMSINLVRDYYLHGGGYTSVAWQESNTIEALNKLPMETPIITNLSAAVLLWTDRPSYDFCTLPCNQPDDLRYGDNLDDEVQQVFSQQGAALVLFYPFCAPQDVAWNVEWMGEVEKLTHDLTVFEYSCDGAIYFYP